MLTDEHKDFAVTQTCFGVTQTEFPLELGRQIKDDLVWRVGLMLFIQCMTWIEVTHKQRGDIFIFLEAGGGATLN